MLSRLPATPPMFMFGFYHLLARGIRYIQLNVSLLCKPNRSSVLLTKSMSLQPVIFLSHGAGPAWFIDSRKESVGALKDVDMHSKSADTMRNLRNFARLPRNPCAILVISAHWEEAEHTVSTSAQPSLYFDYYGFPASTYTLEWPVPGEPKVARSVVRLLTSNGIKCCENDKRGLDHGVFVSLKLAYLEADIPGEVRIWFVLLSFATEFSST